MPTTSISSNLNDEWVDSIEVPEAVAKDAFLVFDSMGLLCAELGLVDFLHGHEPQCVDMSTCSLSVRFPPRAAGEGLVHVTVPAGGSDDNVASVLKEQHGLSEDEQWTVLNIQRALAGFQSDVNQRSLILQMRLQCLFIVIHSRHVPDTIHEYLKPGSTLVKDLVELSDLSSEVSSALNLQDPLALANVALENVLALLECKLRRRGGPIVQTSIMGSLGLTRLGAGAIVAVGANEDAWSSVVIAACAVSSQLFGSKFEKSATTLGKNEAAGSSSDEVVTLSNAAVNNVGKFVRIGLELYALSLTTRDPSHVVQDMALVSTIIGLLQAATPHVQSVLLKLRLSSSDDHVLSAHDVQTMLVVAKALYCLELTVEHSGYTAAFRESEGLAVVAGIIKIFSGVDEQLAENSSASPCSTFTALLKANMPARSAVESALSVLYCSIQKSRQTAMMQGTADSGLREVNQTYFNSFCASVFRSPFAHNEVLWDMVLVLLRETVDLDPPFLAMFLTTPAAEALVVAITRQPVDAAVGSFGENVDLEGLLLSLARFAASVVIIAEGKQYLVRAKIVPFILETLVGPKVVLPENNGLVGDKLVKIGKALSQVLTDCDAVRAPTKLLLRDKLMSLSLEATRVWATLPLAQAPRLDSPRLQVIQRLANLCTVVENMFSETRRQFTELMKEVMPDSVLDALVIAFQCTLPPSRQLFAQISIRNSTTFPHFGHVPSAKAITSLLRVAASTAPSTFLNILYRNIDDQLEKIGKSKQALSLTAADAGSAGPLSAQSVDCKDKEPPSMMDVVPTKEELPSSGSAKRAKTAHHAVNVHIVGVLDHFPHLCLVDPKFADFLASSSADADSFEKHAWQYLSATLTIGWLSGMLANTLRSIPKMTSTTAVVQGKDVFRRLFAFHRSTMLEVSRFGASNWQDTVRSSMSFFIILCLT